MGFLPPFNCWVLMFFVTPQAGQTIVVVLLARTYALLVGIFSVVDNSGVTFQFSLGSSVQVSGNFMNLIFMLTTTALEPYLATPA